MGSQEDEQAPWRQKGGPQQVPKKTVWGESKSKPFQSPLVEASQGRLKKSLRATFENKYTLLMQEKNERPDRLACIEKQLADLKAKYNSDMMQAKLGSLKGIYNAENAAHQFAAKNAAALPGVKNSPQGSNVIAAIRKGMSGDTTTLNPWQPRYRQQSTPLLCEATSSSPSDAATVRTSAPSAFG
jgi:hypothetical protein